MICLPAFFITAGICSNTNMSPCVFFRRKTLRLLIPYILFSVISWVAWVCIAQRYGKDVDHVEWWQPLIGILCGKVEMMPHNRPLWFLCCLISLEWLYYLVCMIPHKAGRIFGAICIGMSGCILSYFGKTGIWEITAAMLMLPIYAIGAEGREWLIRNASRCTIDKLSINLCAALLGIYIGYRFNPQFHISTCQVGNPFLFYLTAISAVGLWYSIALLLERMSSHATKALQYIGENTLIVLCTHIPVFGIIKGIAVICNASLDFFSTSLGCICLWGGTFAILMPAAYIINRYCPWVIGKKRSTP